MILCYMKYVFFSVWMLHHNISGTTLTITPSQVQIGGANPTALNGTCSPPTEIQATYSIYIGRKRLSSGIETPMVEIALGIANNQPVIKDGSLRSRLSAQGDINNNPKSLSFSLKDPTCNDIKNFTFYCKAQFVPDFAGSKEDSKNVTYRVNPDNVRMFVFPQYDYYDLGTLVTFNCTGLIGSSFPSDQSNLWIWEWRDVSQTIPTRWTRYPNSANITYRTPTQAANCNYNGGSELRHTVTEFDGGRQFRCYIANSDLHSANSTINFEDHPYCLITSDDDTDDLTIGNTLTLKAAIEVKFCSITSKYTLLSGSLTVTDFVNVHGLFYATFEVKSEYLDKPLHLKYTCNNVSATTETEGVTNLLTKDQPYCLITSDDDTDDLTIGNTLTLKAAIKVKSCTTKVKYTLLSGLLMVTEFVSMDGLFYATFEVKPEYLENTLHLQYTCNNVSAITETEGVTNLFTKGNMKGIASSTLVGLAIGLPIGILLLAALLGILIIYHLKCRRSPSDDTPMYDVPSHETNTDNRYQDLIRGDDNLPRASEIQTFQNVEYETIQPVPDTDNSSCAQHGNVDNV